MNGDSAFRLVSVALLACVVVLLAFVGGQLRDLSQSLRDCAAVARQFAGDQGAKP